MATTPKKPAPKGRKKPAQRKAPKKPPHGPPHVPTAETRAAVQALAANGSTHKEITDYLSKMMAARCASEHTLRKHYATELGLAKTHQRLMVSQGLYRKAVGAPATFDKQGNKLRDEVKPEVTAQIFWLKCQANWVEPQKHEHSGPEGKPIPVNISSLTDSQLDQLIARLETKVGGA